MALSKEAKQLKKIIQSSGIGSIFDAIKELIGEDEVTSSDEIMECISEMFEDSDSVNLLSKFNSNSLMGALEEQGELDSCMLGHISNNPDRYILLDNEGKQDYSDEYRSNKIKMLRNILGVNHIAGKSEMQEQFDELLKYFR